MKTDLELLKAAANAAGITIIRSRLDDPMHCDLLITLSVRNPHHNFGGWNPLTDDGDALRLCASLRINVEYIRTMGGIDAGVNAWPAGHGDCGMTVEGDDAAMCARRAIVLAAAAMVAGYPGAV